MSDPGWSGPGGSGSPGAPRDGGSGHQLAAGITDLMTSLAVIFILLLVVFASAPAPPAPPPARPTPAAAPPPAPVPAREAPVEPAPHPAAEALAELTRLGLILEAPSGDPHLLRLVVPDTLLTFEFGRSALTPAADRFLSEMMPVYARAMCSSLREQVAGVVIEGHTDDLGGDALNLRLSQERSFRVLVRGLEAIRTAAPAEHDCFAALASASGRGKQDLVYDAARRPDRASSRRVVFKIILRSAAGQRARAGS
jgi:outer membrane protein OmpA-like peptidoglycan-associated protein